MMHQRPCPLKANTWGEREKGRSCSDLQMQEEVATRIWGRVAVAGRDWAKRDSFWTSFPLRFQPIPDIPTINSRSY